MDKLIYLPGVEDAQFEKLNNIIDEAVQLHIKSNHSAIEAQINNSMQKCLTKDGNVDIVRLIPHIYVDSIEMSLRVGVRATIAAMINAGFFGCG